MTLMHMILSGLLLTAVGGRAWSILRRKGSWKPLMGWIAIAVLAYGGFIALIAGPGAKVLDRLPESVFITIVAVLALAMVLGLSELGFRALDGPFPELPGGVLSVNISRRRLYPWVGGAAVAVLIMAGALRICPDAWHDNLLIATWLAGLVSCIALWFMDYKARRFDYGRTVLQANPWFHWVYTAGDLQGFKGIKPGAGSDTWMGPDGLLFNGEYAPWALYVYQLMRAEVNNDPPPSLDFTFRQTSFGYATSLDVFHIPIPADHASDIAVIERKLRTLCPGAEIKLSS
jgi:hypothetical protein